MFLEIYAWYKVFGKVTAVFLHHSHSPGINRTAESTLLCVCWNPLSSSYFRGAWRGPAVIRAALLLLPVPRLLSQLCSPQGHMEEPFFKTNPCFSAWPSTAWPWECASSWKGSSATPFWAEHAHGGRSPCPEQSGVTSETSDQSVAPWPVLSVIWDLFHTCWCHNQLLSGFKSICSCYTV